MAGKSPIARRVNRNTLFADIAALVGASTSFNAGDFLKWDTPTKTIKKMVGESDGANFLGVSVVSVVNGKTATAYATDVDASLGYASIPGPEFGDEVNATLKAGDAITPGAPLYFDPATTTNGLNGVTVTAGTFIIGYYGGPALTAATGGTIIQIKLGARFVSSGLLIG